MRLLAVHQFLREEAMKFIGIAILGNGISSACGLVTTRLRHSRPSIQCCRRTTMSANGWYGGSTRMFVVGFLFVLAALFAAMTWGTPIATASNSLNDPAI